MDAKQPSIALSLRIGGKLMDLSTPRILGILNATPDSFFAGSRCQKDEEITHRAREIVSQGADILDIGAYSSRPGAADISPQEECDRLGKALTLIRKEFPDFPISVDTFRAEVARFCVKEFGVAIINDISGGGLDDKMFETVAELKVAYILMHMRGTPQTMNTLCDYENLMDEICIYFGRRIDTLTRLGVCDIILDPGFGFSKTVEQNFILLHQLEELKLFGLPILSAISRKSMIYKTLQSTPEESLNGTTVLNTISLMKGADLLRVHDVRAAKEALLLTTKTLNAY